MSTIEALEHVATFRARVATAHALRYRRFLQACARERFAPRPVSHDDWQQVNQATVREGTKPRSWPAGVWRLK